MAETVILAEQNIGFAPDSDMGVYAATITPPSYMLVEGETYTVFWDGEKHVCECVTVNINDLNWECIGNMAILGGVDTGEPFGIASIESGGVAVHNALLAVDNASIHKVAIYLGEIEDATLIIKNPKGEDANYPVKPKLRVNTSDGNKLVYSKGEAVENVPISLDFSKGDQTFVLPNGQLAMSAVIQKPENLRPENIVKDVEIAGIVGISEGGGGGSLEDIMRYFQCHVDPVTNTITLYKMYYDLIYADTGSYDVTIPDTICGMAVVIVAE